ncbi:hypothetical protein LOTGIDRAFT_231712 [Lottia gigantea]|uniref:Uncharacterized protein n=1 Tax=Lottia gigantea TaxID=225164 RepID=V4AIS3_LOTGI|nr:hypothetical protein LOTGIDRAFT_231712 [Lottia gigantea]ESO96912.1 hypothetical protein LOTGIDRAFT_231712 [Lottia gigantea]
MSFPDIHCCSRLTAENIEIKKRYSRLKQEKEKLQKQIDVIFEQRKVEALLKNYVTSRDVYVQTESQTWNKTKSTGISSKPSTATGTYIEESEKINKLVNMQSQIMKRYEKEVKQNMEHLQTITELNGKIAQFESKLQKSEEELFKIKHELFKISGPSSSKLEDGVRQKDIIKENTKLKKENKKLRAELDGLDKGFFDEVEDIKYALQQSAKLNKEYEKVLKKMCQKYGVPLPHPEKILNS